MPEIHFFLDFNSNYAYLAFHQLPRALDGLAYQVVHRPMLLGALFKAHGTVSPAMLAPKRDWIYRHTTWLAQQQGVPFEMPAVHPFQSVHWLRMALAASPQGLPGRQVCETLFNAVWQGGRDANDADYQQQVWQELVRDLPQVRDPADAAVKAELFANGDAALQHGVFGAPTFVLMPPAGQENAQAQLFWGLDSLPMLRDAVAAQQPGAAA